MSFKLKPEELKMSLNMQKVPPDAHYLTASYSPFCRKSATVYKK